LTAAERAERRLGSLVDAAWEAHWRGDRETGHRLVMRAVEARRAWKRMKNEKGKMKKTGNAK